MYPANGLESKATALAIFSISPTRRTKTSANIGRIARLIFFHGESSWPIPLSLATVRNRPSIVALRIVSGETVLTVIPSAATALANEAVVAFIAA